MRNLTQVEGMSLDVLRAGIRWEFETVPEYFDMLERQGSAINIAGVRRPLVGAHLRDGRRRSRAARRPPAEVRSDACSSSLEGMRAGAVGFATQHLARAQRRRRHPDALAPRRRRGAASRWSAACRRPRGVFMLTKGGQTQSAVPRGARRAERTAGRHRGAASQQHQSGRGVSTTWTRSHAANARGRRLVGAISCCPLTMDFTLRSPYVFEGLAAWKPALALKGEAFKRVIAQPGFREAIRAELAQPARCSACSTANGTRCTWSRRRARRTAALENRSSPRSAARRARTRSTRMLDLALAEDLRHGVHRAAAQLRRGGGRRACSGTRAAWCRSRMRARTSRSSTTRASGCTCSATGCASGAR